MGLIMTLLALSQGILDYSILSWTPASKVDGKATSSNVVMAVWALNHIEIKGNSVVLKMT